MDYNETLVNPGLISIFEPYLNLKGIIPSVTTLLYNSSTAVTKALDQACSFF